MKHKSLLLLCALFIKVVAYSQRTIQMEYDNGIYRIPCTVNGANMKMVFDTGASTVCLSLATALFLYQNGYITHTDIKGTGQSSTASGDIVNNMIINLKDVEIGGMHLHNVEGVVMESLNAPLLLGQTAIQKLGSITIKGNQLIINDANSGSPYRYSKAQYFRCNGYLLESNVLIRNLQMNYKNWCDERDLSNKKRSGIAKAVDEIIGYIRRGQCNYSLNSLHFTDNYGNLKRSKKEKTYVSNAVYYISSVAMEMIQNGEYVR